MNYLFTSESVSEGHPDKVADQISDAILDEFLRQDSEAKVACETFCSTGLVVVGGEVRSDDAYVDIQSVARAVIDRIGYNKAEYMFDSNSCGVLSALHEQSADIRRGVVANDPDEQGAGDQGMMFGYACRETANYMPLPLALAHRIMQTLAHIRKHEPELMPYLRPDAKAQITVEYDGDTHKPVRIHTIVISTQHNEFVAEELLGSPAPCGEGSAKGNEAYNRSAEDAKSEVGCSMTYEEAVAKFGEERVDACMREKIVADVRSVLLPMVIRELDPATAALFDDNFILHVNPTGKFVIGGPHGDTGLTGRKTIVDTYGGMGAHGGGAFSGKDASKVDRSASYMARYIAKNLVAAGIADRILLQIAYAIGIARPVSIYVNSYGTAHANREGRIFSDAEIAAKVGEIFDLRPAKIIEKFQLKNPIYEPTAAYGHVGREPYKAEVEVVRNGQPVRKTVQFFGWELLDSVSPLRSAFGF